MNIMGSPFPVPQDVPLSVQALLVAAVLWLLCWSLMTWYKTLPFSGFPVISLPGLSPKQSWLQNGHQVVAAGARTGAAFQVMTGTGPKIVLPNHFAEEIKSHPNLSFNDVAANEFFAHMSGFEPFAVSVSKHGNVIVDVVRGNLTQSLGLVTHDLVDEALCSIHDEFGENAEWHSVSVKEYLLTVVARLSSRVFLGKGLCRDEQWLDIAKNYTISSFLAARQLRKISPLFRPIAHQFLKSSNDIRKQYRDAGNLIMPEIERRRQRAAKAQAAGQKPPKTADTIAWIHDKTKGAPVDYVGAQLGLTLAAIHTTTEATMDAIADVCAFPDLQHALRSEIIEVIGQEGWSRTGLYKMKLMDSFLKESQRFHPNGSTAMARRVHKKMTLSDGTVLPKGANIMLNTRYADPKLYPDADKFDAYRFMKLRETSGTQTTHQHVTVSPEHLAFGYGQHACPGRFFASNEIKIALSILLLKYEWSFEQGQTLDDCFLRTEAQLMTKPQVNLRVRRRQEEVSLDLPAQ